MKEEWCWKSIKYFYQKEICRNLFISLLTNMQMNWHVGGLFNMKFFSFMISTRWMLVKLLDTFFTESCRRNLNTNLLKLKSTKDHMKITFIHLSKEHSLHSKNARFPQILQTRDALSKISFSLMVRLGRRRLYIL